MSLINHRFALGVALAPSGEGQCYAARDVTEDRDVVLKVLPPGETSARQRLVSEFERLAELDHPGLPEAIELGVAEGPGPLPAGSVFFASERLSGLSAAEACASVRGEARARLVAAILADAADALGALHDAGLVHHDVKPEHLIAAPDGRFRLIDLGLARVAGRGDGTVRGTLPYLSPDALVGSTDAAVDVFALGVTAYELLSGRRPFVAADPAALLSAQASPLAVLSGPRALTALIESLMAIDPSARPSHARVIGQELARAGLIDPARAERARRSAAPRLGRPGYVASAQGRAALLETLQAATVPVIALVGGAGSGKTRLVAELDRQRALAALRAGATRPQRYGPTLAAAAAQLGLADLAGQVEALPRARAALCARVIDQIDARAALLHLAAPDPALVEIVVRLASLERAGRIVLELDEDAAASLPPLSAALLRVDVPPLDDEELLALAGRVLGEVSPAVARAAGRRTQGRPGPFIDLLRAACARRTPVTVEVVREVRLDALEVELGALVRGLPPPSAAILAALALLDRPASPDELEHAVAAPVANALGALAAARLVDWQDAGVVPDSRALTTAALSERSARARTELGLRLLEAADARGALFEAAFVALAIARPDATARAARALTALLEGEPCDASPLMILEARVHELARSIRGPLGARLEGELLLRRAEYEAAARRLTEADHPSVSAAGRAEAVLLRARALRLGGKADEAAAALDAIPDGNEVGSAARALRARLHLDRGDATGAREALGRDRRGDSIAVQIERAEISGLASLQSGEVAAASSAFGELARLLGAAPPARRARAEALLGMTAQAAGVLDDAAASYERALTLAEEGGDPHGAAVYAQNLGGTLRELGELARAEAPLRRACEGLARLGRPEERALAWYNLGNLQRSVGDLDAAGQAAEVALALVAAAPESRAALYARVLAADVARRRGDLPRALAAYRAITASGIAERVVVEAGLGETLAEAGDRDAARGAAERLKVLAADPAVPQDVRAHAMLGEARIRLTEAGPLPEALHRALVEDAAAADRSGRRLRSLELEIVLATDAVRRGDLATVHTRLASAQRAHEEMLMRTPELRRAALDDDPDVQRLRALSAALAPPVTDAPSQRLLEINKRLNSELDLERLLELILDTVLELTRAERGFVLTRAAGGELEVRTERNVDPALRAGAAAFSRSIAERAAQLGEPIVTVDAAGDARFEAALSVSDLRLRSVLAVPLSVKGRVVGCVYVDHRARVGLFRPADVALVAALAEQAAIAVENARLLAENHRRQAEIRALNEALTQKLDTQTVELEGMHREVREARRRLGVRYDYSGLIGQTPRMLELFRLLDRVTDTALPVVIYGESGTGKELVARALHHNGPRRKAAFVSESCGAIPETLLEAALFGHVRGAFTGAQGERRGLFEIADGGTLFLDEVGEMSSAMQVRLLRVLQEGEFRRVGGEKLLKVDVRVVVASNRDLGRMVEAGQFREDLFYRLNVVRVALPPLRERSDDIPLLVEHLLEGHGKRGVTRRALEHLTRYSWPGNVRQLENELARASSLADGAIDLPDLSPAVQAGTAEAEVAGPEPLALRQRVERLERGLLQEALHRTGGNQSEAARLLGLSRFGLQKKLRRYRMRATRRGAPAER